jgi:two-component system, OmpR family, osmolarity sensor histidine kinase EnvZ
MRRPWSLVRRLTGGVVAVALVAFATQAVVMALWIRPVAGDVASAAAEQAQQVRAALAALPAPARAALAERLSVGQVKVVRAEPIVPAPMDSLLPRPVPPEFSARAAELALAGIQLRVLPTAPERGRGLLLIARLPIADGDTWWLERHVQGPAGAVSSTLMLWLAMLALATAGALFVSVRFIARPLARLAAQLSDTPAVLRPLSAGPDPSAELQSLVAAFNRLVSQVTQAGADRQALLAGVSHDLRTPLARLRLRVETQCEPALAAAFEQDLQALQRIVDQFLAYVQGDAALVAVGRPAALDATVRAAAERQAALGQPATLQIDEVPWPLPELAVQRIVANLIDNAHAHGQAPVALSLVRTAGGAELRVHDAGPGLDEAEFERARQPFVRLSNARAELGHCGLGLAIVSQLARQLGAQLSAGRPEGGGFEVAVAIPSSPRHGTGSAGPSAGGPLGG